MAEFYFFRFFLLYFFTGVAAFAGGVLEAVADADFVMLFMMR
jgi:hypothetical protein